MNELKRWDWDWIFDLLPACYDISPLTTDRLFRNLNSLNWTLCRGAICQWEKFIRLHYSISLMYKLAKVKIRERERGRGPTSCCYITESSLSLKSKHFSDPAALLIVVFTSHPINYLRSIMKRSSLDWLTPRWYQIFLIFGYQKKYFTLLNCSFI